MDAADTTGMVAVGPLAEGSLSVESVPLLDHLNGGRGVQFDLLHAAKITVPKAAKALGIGETKMREIIRNGDVSVVKVMGKTLLLERDLENYLHSGYGRIKPVQREVSRLPPLPQHIRESQLLNKAS